MSVDQLRYVGPHDDRHLVLQPGMSVKIGVGPDTDCRSPESTTLCSESISVVLKNDEQYEPSCEVACNLWERSDCGSFYNNFSSTKCWDECLSSDSSTEMGSVGWGWNYVSCIEPIVLDVNLSKEMKCARMTKMCRDVFQANDSNFLNNKETRNDYISQVVVGIIAGIVGVSIMIASMLHIQPPQDTQIEFVPIPDRSVS